MSDPLQDKINAALAGLGSSTDPSKDAELLGILKTAFELQKIDADRRKVEEDTLKASIDRQLASRQSRSAIVSAMLGPLVPFTSLLTVLATIFISSQQLKSANDQALTKLEEERVARADVNWKSFEDSVDKDIPDNLYSSITFVSRLRAFAKAGQHNDELLDITKHFMLRLSSASAFRNIWNITFNQTTNNNIDQVIELARGVRNDYDALVVECKSFSKIGSSEDKWLAYMGNCSPTISDDEILKKYSDGSELQRIQKLRQKRNDNSSLQYFLSTEISNFLRRESNKKTGPKNLDLSGIYILAAQLEDVDFSLANLSGTAFTQTSLGGSRLTPRGISYDFRSTAWWNVESIDQEILKQAIAFAYPVDTSNLPALFNMPNDYSISEDDYRSKIAKLCTKKMSICLPECLRFGTRNVIADSKCDPKKN